MLFKYIVHSKKKWFAQVSAFAFTPARSELGHGVFYIGKDKSTLYVTTI